MRHFDRNEWKEYVSGQMPEVKTAEMERHLSACDDCLNVYIEEIEAADALPDIANKAEWREKVGVSLASAAPVGRLSEKSGRDGKTDLSSLIRNYAVAAAITLILLGSGGFDALTARANALTDETAASSQGAFSREIWHELKEFWTNMSGGTER